MSQPTHEQRPFADVLSDLARETGALLAEEATFAKTRATRRARGAAKDGAVVLVGAVLAMMGALAFIGGSVLAMAHVMPPWAAALLVGTIVMALGVIVAMWGLHTFTRAESAEKSGGNGHAPRARIVARRDE